MRLALLCDDVTVIPWIDAIIHDPNHELTLAVALTETARELLRGRSGIKLTPYWEDLVGGHSFDALLVGGSEPQVLEAIKQLAASGQTLLFVPKQDQGSTFIYELSLIRDDNHVPIHPALWHRCDPALRRARDAIHDGSLGRVQLIQFQRELPTQGSSLVPQSEIDAAMLLDVDLLRWLSGDYDQVTALQTGACDQGALTQSVKLAGRNLPEATWDVCAGNAPISRLKIHTDRGVTNLEQNPGSLEWTVTGPDGVCHSGDRQAAVLNYLQSLESNSTLPMEWPELVKAFETVDATHRSIRRRRTIDLHFEPMSERAIFKTQMTAIGCSVLIATFLLVLVYLAIASTVPLPDTALLVLRTMIFAPLGLFLLLQLLYPLTRPSEAESSSAVK
ncbi:MAG: hypothetical protein JSS49_20530 [Planctomycetes bacterium]|nr:hypothetical protein [Planctomycetota bacterium]